MSKGSLTFPADPLAAMRELGELDNAPPQSAATAVLTAIHQDILKDSSQDSSLSVNRDDKMDSKTADQPAVKPAVRPAGKSARQIPRQKSVQPASSTASSEAASLDPLDQALLQKLARPYPDLAKGKSTLISSRLPDDVVERLGLAADLVKKHKKTKQDVITRGLILAFQELIENDGAVEWYE